MHGDAVYVMPGDNDSMVGQMTTKKCSGDKKHKTVRHFSCPMGSQYCSDDNPMQCQATNPVFPWVGQSHAPAPPTHAPSYERPRVSLEAEVCLKIDDSMCALKSQICAAYGSDDKLCHMMNAVCKKLD